MAGWRGEDDDEDYLAEDEDPDESDQGEEDDQFSCPHCGRSVWEDAEICPHCHNFISFSDQRQLPRWVLVAAALALAAALTWIFW